MVPYIKPRCHIFFSYNKHCHYDMFAVFNQLPSSWTRKMWSMPRTRGQIHCGDISCYGEHIIFIISTIPCAIFTEFLRKDKPQCLSCGLNGAILQLDVICNSCIKHWSKEIKK